MKQLRSQTYAQVCAKVLHIARPLDQAVLTWSRDVAQRDQAATLLSAFQNPDGGYGHGIEPDMWTPDSGPLTTTIGLQYALLLGLPATHPAVHQALAYLASQVDVAKLQWLATAPTVNDTPHAPWWHRGADGLSAIDALSENPTVEILGYFHQYQPHTDVQLIDTIAAQAVTRLAAQPDCMEEHVLACYVRWYRLAPPQWQVQLLPQLRRTIAGTINCDPVAWRTTYVPTPLLVVESAQDPWYDVLADAVTAQCAFLIETLERDGCIQPTWTWGQYPAQWQIAHAHWTGKLTVEALLALARFGAIAHGAKE
jgi:hypothetical protein